MTICPKCQAEQKTTGRFCTKCGATLAASPGQTAPASDGKTVVAPPPTIAASASVPAAKTIVAPPVTLAGSTGVPAGTATGRTEMIADSPSTEDSGEDLAKLFETSGVCPKCFAPMKKGSIQCDECGYRLTGNYCPKCSAPIDSGATVCPECHWSGTLPAGATAMPVAPPTLPGVVSPTVAAVSQATVAYPQASSATVVAPAAPLGQTVSAAPAAVTPPAAPARKGFPVALVLIILFLGLCVLGGGGFLAWQFYLKDKFAPSPEAELNPPVNGPVAPKQTEPGSTGPATTGPGPSLPVPDLRQEAERLYQSGDFQAALAAVEKHLQQNQGDGGAYALAARICRDLGKLEDAQRYLLTALSFDQNNAEYRLELGKLYSAAGFSDKAVEQYQEAVRLMPGNEEALWCLVQEFSRTGDLEKTKRAAGGYLRQFPAGSHAAEARAIVAPPVKTAGPATPPVSSGPEPLRPPTRPDPGPGHEPAPPPPPPPSPYVTVVLDASALSLPGQYAEIVVSFAGIQQKFNSNAAMRIDNIEKGAFPYNVSVVYFNASNNERDRSYSGTGSITIRYPNQKIYLRRLGEQIKLQ